MHGVSNDTSTLSDYYGPGTDDNVRHDVKENEESVPIVHVYKNIKRIITKFFFYLFLFFVMLLNLGNRAPL